MSLPKLLNISFEEISKPTNLKLNNEKIIEWGTNLIKTSLILVWCG